MNDFEKRIESESQSESRITNADLPCKDCIYRLDDTRVFGNTSKCIRFYLKPNWVITNKECSEYKKED